LTSIGEPIGAKATIAPEMKIDAKNADGKKADVYSLAKTMWMILTENDYSFDGIYNSDSKLMGLRKYYKEHHYYDVHIVELEQLLVDCTQDVPALRPTMEQFIIALEEWFEIYKNYERSNLSQWSYIQNKLFPTSIPKTASWEDLDDIIKVLNFLGDMPSLNHMFIPSGGGLDFDYTEIAVEPGCIALHASQNVFILKPMRLIVENIHKDFKWSYFMLVADTLEPTYLNEIHDNEEYLTEDLSGHYVSWICGNYGHYENGDPLPENFRLVTRVLNGTFALFSKASTYNDISGTYDARHNLISDSDFRNYIESLCQDEKTMTYHDFMKKHNCNPFIEDTSIDEDAILCRIKNKEILKSLLKDYFYKTDFSNICGESAFAGDINILHYTLAVNFNDGFFKPYLKLGKDGKFLEETNSRHLLSNNSTGLFLFPTIDELKKFVANLENTVSEICVKNDLPMKPGLYYFSIYIIRNIAPTHIFTKEEIKEVLMNGNDHKNNTLVIDGQGYARLIEEEKHFILRQYPVIHESFGAYNNNTGKYSLLSRLEDLYISSLQGWLSHLENCRCVKIDYCHDNRNERELLGDIQNYYQE
jgi:hypothetical protein